MTENSQQNNSNDASDQNDSIPVLNISLGQKIKSARQEQNLSLGDVAERLKLSVKQIEALERDDFDCLPSIVFARGFVRSYAKLLKMNEEETAKDIDQVLPFDPSGFVKIADPVAPENQMQGKPGLDDGKKGRLFLLFCVLVIICLGIGWFAYKNSQTRQTEEQEKSFSVLGDEPVTGNTENILVSQENLSASEVVSAENTASSLNNEGAMTQGLVITPAFRTYLTVQDKDGHVVINKLVPGRSEHHFPASGAPYKVKIGFVKNSVVSFNGKPVDVSVGVVGGTYQGTIASE